MSIGRTKMWTIDEHPGYTIEQTPGAWVLWGPCIDHEYPPESEFEQENSNECMRCGTSRHSSQDGEFIIDTCPIKDNPEGPSEPMQMVSDELQTNEWVPRRIQ